MFLSTQLAEIYICERHVGPEPVSGRFQWPLPHSLGAFALGIMWQATIPGVNLLFLFGAKCMSLTLPHLNVCMLQLYCKLQSRHLSQDPLASDLELFMP